MKKIEFKNMICDRDLCEKFLTSNRKTSKNCIIKKAGLLDFKNDVENVRE